MQSKLIFATILLACLLNCVPGSPNSIDDDLARMSSESMLPRFSKTSNFHNFLPNYIPNRELDNSEPKNEKTIALLSSVMCFIRRTASLIVATPLETFINIIWGVVDKLLKKVQKVQGWLDSC
ncbi:hypothetical protein FQA39_LY17153 [Lamprigera yunnana]|nr:hypothetical protein FQA39_LY17153 [Lamprigera yunnana]